MSSSRSKLLHDRIAELARIYPENVAIRTELRSCTFRQLDDRANQFAHCLLNAGVRPETRVGVHLGRSIELIVAIVAVLRAGGTYVPLDPNYPASRRRFMRVDAGVAVVVCSNDWPWQPDDVAIINIDGDPGTFPTVPPHIPLSDRTAAYIIYTSGSTGAPKGALVSHASVVDYLAELTHFCSMSPADITLHISSISFDPSIRDIFCGLWSGGRVVMLAEDRRLDMDAYIDTIVHEQVTSLLSITPTFLAELIVVASHRTGRLGALKRILTCGEPLLASLAERVAHRFPGANLVNQYGPTECTMTSTRYTVRLDRLDRGIPIGRPRPGVSVFVLDDGLETVSGGTVGELYIGGPGLAKTKLVETLGVTLGLTAAHFIAWSNGQRLYRTGDLARCNVDGDLEFVGRSDSQIKLRGMRIEGGEIEAALSRLRGVHQAAVAVRRDAAGDDYLAAFVVARECPINEEELRRALHDTLPSVMVPRTIQTLEQLPTTLTGKIDRATLVEWPDVPSGCNPVSSPQADPLTDPVMAIWRDVLGVEVVSPDDSFFRLDGSSLKAMRIVSRINEQFGTMVSVRTLFDADDVPTFCDAIEHQMKELSSTS